MAMLTESVDWSMPASDTLIRIAVLARKESAEARERSRSPVARTRVRRTLAKRARTTRERHRAGGGTPVHSRSGRSFRDTVTRAAPREGRRPWIMSQAQVKAQPRRSGRSAGEPEGQAARASPRLAAKGRALADELDGLLEDIDDVLGGERRSVRQGLPPAGGPVADSRPRELPSVEAPRSSRSVGPAARPVTVREVACSPVTGLIDPPPLLGRGDGSGRCCLRRGVQQTREGRPDDAHARSGETLS